MAKTLTVEGMMCPHCEARVKGVLVNQSTKDVLTAAGLGTGSRNRLLHMGFLN